MSEESLGSFKEHGSDSGESWKVILDQKAVDHSDQVKDVATDLVYGNDVVRFVHNKKTMILGFRQHPEQARMIGLTGKDRRPVDPPPILELICLDDQGNRVDCSGFCQEFVACVSLYSKDGVTNMSQVVRLDNFPSDDPRIINSLDGETDTNCQVILDEDGKKVFFFIFPQLSVRIRGEFCLKFVIVNPREAEMNSMGHCPIMAEIFSNPFIVYAIKDFPGVKETTRLSSWVKNQGIRLNSRR